MDRDFRLTGVFRGQSDAVEAPAGFEGELLENVDSTKANRTNSWQQMEGPSLDRLRLEGHTDHPRSSPRSCIKSPAKRGETHVSVSCRLQMHYTTPIRVSRSVSEGQFHEVKHNSIVYSPCLPPCDVLLSGNFRAHCLLLFSYDNLRR